ncbi:MAG: hypothetical protein JWP36_2278 [Paucimonas sp.]|nr:hypothetical protein [Paucimonas sp.]
MRAVDGCKSLKELVLNAEFVDRFPKSVADMRRSRPDVNVRVIFPTSHRRIPLNAGANEEHTSESSLGEDGQVAEPAIGVWAEYANSAEDDPESGAGESDYSYEGGASNGSESDA